MTVIFPKLPKVSFGPIVNGTRTYVLEEDLIYNRGIVKKGTTSDGASVPRISEPRDVNGLLVYKIPGCGPYGITKCGKVYAFSKFVKNDKGVYILSGRWLKMSKGSHGYRAITLQDRKKYLVHRLMAITFLGIKDWQYVEHRDRVRTNNNLDNLRISTQSQNMMNRGKQSNNTSGYKGVSWSRATNKWYASIRNKGHSIGLGLYDSKVDAALAYDHAASKFFGEFAYLNF